MDPLVVLAELASWMWRFWNRSEDMRLRQEAEKVLSKHGLSSFLYLPSVGTEDPKLRNALDRVSFGGRVVLDQHGQLVGRVISKAVKGRNLRLVVDNTIE